METTTPAATVKKPHISATQVDMFTKCGEQYRRRYIEKDVIPPGVALIRGKAIHSGAEYDFRQKMETLKDLPRQEIVDRAAAEFNAQVKADGIYLCEEDAARGKDIILGEGLDEVVRLAGLLADEVLPVYQPIAVEERQLIELPSSPRDILGILDVVAWQINQPKERFGLVDYKSGKSKPQSHWDAATGLTIYALTFRAKYRQPPAFINVEQLVTNKTPKRVLVTTTRDKADFVPCISRMNAVLAGIEKQVFVPAMPGAWWCSPKWCGYWTSCSFVNSERKAAAAAAGE
ncbi:MAG: PD-(D/E)XK nuclease family protein [Elusimicrobia bacterium]|nr:PD-(D/E)XK nuclease family protein [Elusimicrobiota bacterium]